MEDSKKNFSAREAISFAVLSALGGRRCFGRMRQPKGSISSKWNSEQRSAQTMQYLFEATVEDYCESSHEAITSTNGIRKHGIRALRTAVRQVLKVSMEELLKREAEEKEPTERKGRPKER
jgi:hypothetical protein